MTENETDSLPIAFHELHNSTEKFFNITMPMPRSFTEAKNLFYQTLEDFKFDIHVDEAKETEKSDQELESTDSEFAEELNKISKKVSRSQYRRQRRFLPLKSSGDEDESQNGILSPSSKSSTDILAPEAQKTTAYDHYMGSNKGKGRRRAFDTHFDAICGCTKRMKQRIACCVQ